MEYGYSRLAFSNKTGRAQWAMSSSFMVLAGYPIRPMVRTAHRPGPSAKRRRRAATDRPYVEIPQPLQLPRIVPPQPDSVGLPRPPNRTRRIPWETQRPSTPRIQHSADPGVAKLM